MHWQLKAALMKTFSVCPAGERVHYWAQRRLTRSLPRSSRELREKLAHGKKHIEALKRYGSVAISDSQFFEFGAGWDLAVPFSLYALGAKCQIVIDVSELAHVDLLNDTLQKLCHFAEETAPVPGEVPPFPAIPQNDWVASLRDHYGIRYLAPCDARSTGLRSESIDCITSTDTLEHIPEEDICLIFKECRRLLRKDGILSFVIDYRDHYSYCDPHISPYNFLQFRQTAWEWRNSRLSFQNRLRHKDYLRLAKAQGFQLLEENCEAVSPEDLADLQRIRLAPPFRAYAPEELSVRRGHFVLRLATY